MDAVRKSLFFFKESSLLVFFFKDDVMSPDRIELQYAAATVSPDDNLVG